MICSKDFLERLLNDKAQSVDKSNINLPKNFFFFTKWVIWTCVASNLCNLISHDLPVPTFCPYTGEYGSMETRILAYFMQCILSILAQLYKMIGYTQ